MEKIGLRPEVHAVRESLRYSRGWLGGCGHALGADDWRTRR
jgi:hypothetical protein